MISSQQSIFFLNQTSQFQTPILISINKPRKPTALITNRQIHPHKPSVLTKLSNLNTIISKMADLPTKDDIKSQAIGGRPITQAEASAIASEESGLTGSGPIKGGAAATAQSLHDKQMNFLEKAGEVVRKPPTEVTKEDAAEVQRAEVRYRDNLGGDGELTDVGSRQGRSSWKGINCC
jgi:hypothetical protein